MRAARTHLRHRLCGGRRAGAIEYGLSEHHQSCRGTQKGRAPRGQRRLLHRKHVDCSGRRAVTADSSAARTGSCDTVLIADRRRAARAQPARHCLQYGTRHAARCLVDRDRELFEQVHVGDGCRGAKGGDPIRAKLARIAGPMSQCSVRGCRLWRRRDLCQENPDNAIRFRVRRVPHIGRPANFRSTWNRVLPKLPPIRRPNWNRRTIRTRSTPR